MIVSIHQPNLVPWLPYFEKIAAADVFVVLKHCQFEKGGYQNRFNVGDTWHTMPVERGLEPIAKKCYVDAARNWQRITGKLPELAAFDDCVSDRLATMNHAIIVRACEMLGIGTLIAEDEPSDLMGTDRLVAICQAHGATTYLSGPSGRDYMDLSKFEAAGIAVEFHEAKDKRPLIDALAAAENRA